MYLKAAHEWLKLEGNQAASLDEWGSYNWYTLAGAVLFVLEPWLDFAGVWRTAVLSTLEHAQWEWANATDSDEVNNHANLPPPQRRTGCLSRRVWAGYSVADERSVPTTASLMRADLDFWAAVFFLVASLFYLYQAAVPYVYEDFCRCNDERRGCRLDAMADTPTSSSGTLNSVRAVGYCTAGWLASVMFVFDAAIGLSAWYVNRQHVQLLLGRARPVDWLGISATLFMVGAALEVIDCIVDNAVLNFIAQFCWLLNGFAYLIDAYDTRELAKHVHIPSIISQQGQTCADDQSPKLRWAPL